jgi:hypothetical protein
MTQYPYRAMLALTLGGLLAGCGGGSDNSRGPATGQLSLSLTDAPVDQVYTVNLQIRGATIKPQSGPALDFTFPAPIDVDLLSLQNGDVFDLLSGETVPAGAYNWIELHANAALDGTFDSYVMETEMGAMVELRTPSGSTRFVSGFTVTAGQNNAFVLDWDVRRALTNPNGLDGWHLTSAHRLIDMTQFGTLSGTVADALLMDSACTSDAEGNGNVVYVYSGHDVVPDDMGSATEPLTSAPVALDPMMAGAYTYSVPFLDPGPYTVAFTCQGLDDLPDSDQVAADELVFGSTVNADVAEGQGSVNEAPVIE